MTVGSLICNLYASIPTTFTESLAPAFIPPRISSWAWLWLNMGSPNRQFQY